MRTVVVTGGSRAIGAAIVARFAARGDRVYFLYEKNHRAAKAVSEKTGAIVKSALSEPKYKYRQ